LLIEHVFSFIGTLTISKTSDYENHGVVRYETVQMFEGSIAAIVDVGIDF